MISLRQLGIPMLVLGIAAVALAPAAQAKTTTFRLNMSGLAETPPNTTKGTGSGTVRYNDQTHMLRWYIRYKGLTGPATAAHFHGPAAAGASAPPVVPIDPSKLASPIKGTATLTEDQAKQLLDGQWYFNVHTQANPNGEIRGQLIAGSAGHRHHRHHHHGKAASGAKTVPTDIPSSNNETNAPQGSPPPVQSPAQ